MKIEWKDYIVEKKNRFRIKIMVKEKNQGLIFCYLKVRVFFNQLAPDLNF
jgi:hypothetical protein